MIINSGFGFKRFTYSSAPPPPGPEDIGTTYKTITINKSLVPSTQTNYVAKIAANLFTSDFFTKLNSGGSARFTLDDGETQLPHEKVYLDIGDSKGYYNVLIPTVNGTAESTSTSIRVYYENNLSDLSPTATYGRNNVWVNNYKCVQHLQITPDQLQVNSTGDSNYDMTGLGGLISTDVITGLYGGGNAHYYESSQGVAINYCDLTGYPYSIGCVFKTPAYSDSDGYICGVSSDTTAVWPIMHGLVKYGLKDTKTLRASGSGGLGGGILDGANAGNVTTTNWYFGLAVYESATSRKCYVGATNGSNVESIPFISRQYTGIAAIHRTSSNITYANDLAVQDFFITDSIISADTYTTMNNNYTNGSFFTIT